jgi:hypothetical protein
MLRHSNRRKVAEQIDRYVRQQHRLAKARRVVLELQLRGETLESNLGIVVLVTDQKAVRKKLSALEEELDVAVGEVRELEQWLIRYRADLVRAQRGGKDPSAPRLGQEEAQRTADAWTVTGQTRRQGREGATVRGPRERRSGRTIRAWLR